MECFDLKAISKDFKRYYANKTEKFLTQLPNFPSKWKSGNSRFDHCSYIGLKKAFKLSQIMAKVLDFLQ